MIDCDGTGLGLELIYELGSSEVSSSVATDSFCYSDGSGLFFCSLWMPGLGNGIQDGIDQYSHAVFTCM